MIPLKFLRYGNLTLLESVYYLKEHLYIPIVGEDPSISLLSQQIEVLIQYFGKTPKKGHGGRCNLYDIWKGDLSKYMPDT